MLRKLFKIQTEASAPAPKEGDLFKVIRTHGATFEIKYGFYEERDRHTKFAEPMAIYPNFIAEPQYTDDGIPFATSMQIPCENFKGKKDEDSVCGDCSYYHPCEELIGICTCPMQKIGSGEADMKRKIE